MLDWPQTSTSLLVASNRRYWDWLFMVTRRLQTKAKHHCLPPHLPITAMEIFQQNLKSVDEVENLDGLSGKRRAIWFREASMIGFLISPPVRRQRTSEP
ncbi:hypothetical protein [Parasedimentitalea huanghaiensis]|uniref:Uncharacterized protein n=1 Tax=Parasedimentitalea huanghaiensis TaxID=2682100 RepID=A0A6L6WT94_9RHOB|nr:hypothetical protein [Zongyanglinia huanghaiensis]MVO18732.1 hypothetical protein [Zongyanglinia huanghaiensis]